jgi:hypothetical protein
VSFTKRCTFKVNEELRKINVLKLQNQEPIFSNEELQELYYKLSVANITDSQIRDRHVEKLKEKDSKEIVKNRNSLSTCKTRGKAVSEKASTYCLLKKEQFKGKMNRKTGDSNEFK